MQFVILVAMNIILIGYRACGKTTVGKMLAEHLWKTFVDIDDEALKKMDSDSITEVFEERGEAVWRDAEVQVTKELVQRLDMVIGLGGGTLMQPEARQAIKQAADTVRIYLRCEPTELLHRIQTDTMSAARRPNLTNLGGGIEEITHVLAEREPVYRAVADKEFDVTHVAAKDALRHIIVKCL